MAKEESASYGLADLTDPEVQAALGSHREGDFLVVNEEYRTPGDGWDDFAVARLSPEQVAICEKREAGK